MSMARSTRSGTLVGPGICRKCLPVCTVMGVLPDIALIVPWLREPLEYHYLAGLSRTGRGPSMRKKQGFALPTRSPAGKTLCDAREQTNGSHEGPKIAEFGGKQRPRCTAGPRDHRRRFLRCLQPRPLRDRRLILPDHSPGRRGAPDHRRGAAGAGDCSRRRPDRHPAWRRHLAMRPDGQRGNRRRLLQTPESHHLARRRTPHLRGRARHRARRSQPSAQKARPLVPGRCLHRLARHHRGHGRQQFLRRTFAALRNHARQHACDGCDAC